MEDFKFGYVPTYDMHGFLFSRRATLYGRIVYLDWKFFFLLLEIGLLYFERNGIYGLEKVLRGSYMMFCNANVSFLQSITFPVSIIPPWGDQVRFLLVVRVNCPNMEYMVRVVDHDEPLKVFAGNSFPTCVVITGENPKGRGTEKEPYIRTS